MCTRSLRADRHHGYNSSKGVWSNDYTFSLVFRSKWVSGENLQLALQYAAIGAHAGDNNSLLSMHEGVP